MTITITELSQILGVSCSTISRVLNSPELVKPETREKVLRGLREHNYVYNALAGGLTKKRSATLGVMLPTITNPVFALTTQGAQATAGQRGYSILLGSHDYSGENEAALVRLFQEKRVDGILFIGKPIKAVTADYLARYRIPYVVTWERPDAPAVPFVAFDNAKSAFHLTDYLLSLGHRRIAMITGRFESSTRAYKRYQGFRAALAQWGVPCEEALIIQEDYTVMDGREAAGRLISRSEPPTAVVCGNDILAMGAMVAARQAGLRVGRDLSVTGFDDLEISLALDPPLTTVRTPAGRMGRKAAELLIDTIEKKIHVACHYLLETELIIRGSTAPPFHRSPMAL
jgi:LacI family transcriptional regulator